MNKDKTKYYKFNLWWCLPTLLGTIGLLVFPFDFPLINSISFALIFYAIDVRFSSEIDWLDDRLKKFEEKESLPK